MSTVRIDTKQSQFTCRRTERIVAAAEMCLDNGLGVCFVVDDGQHLLGRVTLDDIRKSIRDGAAIRDTSLQRHLTDRNQANGHRSARLRNDTAPVDEAVMPIVDYKGRLIDILVDRSKQLVQVARPDLSHLEFRAIMDAFLSSWISSRGSYIQEFEEGFAEFVGMRHGAGCSSGTAALHLALLALGIGPGDEVIVPDLTFASTINAVLYCGATPVIVDVDETTWGLSLEKVESAYTRRTKAIIPVHLYGRPAEIGPIAAFAQARGIYVVEDCAEAHGARYAGRMVGQFSDIACFSFYANKIVTTGEGGMCLTDSAELATKIRQFRDHGMAPGRFYWHERVGYNYRMTNLQAAIGKAQLARVEQTLARNQHLDQLYRRRMGDIPGLRFPPRLGGVYEQVVWLVCVLVPSAARLELMEAAERVGVELRMFFNTLSSMPIYKNYAGACPTSAALSDCGMNLPTSSAIDSRVVEKVAGIFRETLR
jgi:perosamine synthetase